MSNANDKARAARQDAEARVAARHKKAQDRTQLAIQEGQVWANHEFEDERTLSDGINYAMDGEGLKSLTPDELEAFLSADCEQYKENMRNHLKSV